MVRVERDTQQVVDGIKKIMSDYNNYVNETMKIRPRYDWRVIVSRMLKMYETIGLISKPYTSSDTKNLYIKEYTT